MDENRVDVQLARSKSAMKSAIVVMIIAVLLTISLCLAWFIINDQVKTGFIGGVVVDKAFSMENIKITVDGEDTEETSEFTGLLPGSSLKFEVKLVRKISGNLKLRMEFTGIKGAAFKGAATGKDYDTSQLFSVSPIDKNGVPTADARFFNTAVDGTLLFSSGISLDEGFESVTVFFMITFDDTQVGSMELDESISRLAFYINKIAISLEE